jgi:NADPH:quinone reductase-like Zn-dependent oxidoreductase
MEVLMKAVLFRTHGAIDVLEYTEFPAPEPAAGQVLVKLEAAALNRMDVWTRSGSSGIKVELPHITGADGAGTIAGLGADVTEWQIGDRVVINSNLGCGHCPACIAGQDNRCRNWHLLGETVRGTYAEYVAVPATNVLKIPDGFEPRQAAAAALVFHTAWHSLIVRGGLHMGESVLVVGASGGVNTASIQIAKLAGATVYVVGSGLEKLNLAKSLGADYLVDRLAYEDWSRAVFTLTEKRGVDVVVDNVGITFPSSFRAAARGGRILTVGNSGGPKFEIDNRLIFGKHLSVLGSSMGTRTDFATVMGLIFAGKLKPVLDQDFPLQDARHAQERLESGAQLGKITLNIG